MTRLDPDGFDGRFSYSRRETPMDVLRNRVGVTGGLFAIVMSLSVLLGRRR